MGSNRVPKTPAMPTISEILNRLGIAPCKNCTERHVGCHGSCERYISALEIAREKQREIWKERDKSRLADEVLIHGFKERKHKYKKRWGKR